jgi:type II secretory pathway pseudopilin PulG
MPRVILPVGKRFPPGRLFLRPNAGFTLFEICLALFIVLLVLAAAIPATSGLLAEQNLRGEVRELVLFAKTARRQAIQEQRPYQITFSPAGFILEPLAPPVTEKAAPEAAAPFEPLVSTLPSGTVLTLQRWGDKDWIKPKEERWIFQGTGLTEPLSFRFQRGESWIEIDLNPLTASIDEERSTFQ